MPITPVKRTDTIITPRKQGGEAVQRAVSPLDEAMARQSQQTRKLARRNGGADVMEAVLAEVPVQLPQRTAADPKLAKEWSTALQEPVMRAVVNAAENTPQKLAGALVPVLPRAVGIAWQSVSRRWWQRVGRFASGLNDLKVWRWMVEALWEGEPVGTYVEQKAESSEIVQLQLLDIEGQRVLGSAIVPGVEALSESGEGTEYGDEGRFVTFVGERCQLSARVVGVVTSEVKAKLQLLCRDLDRLLEETVTDGDERAALLPQRLQAGLSREGVLTVVGASKRAWAGVTATAVLVLAFISWAGLHEYRWQRFLDLLQKDPGIQVTSYERGWGRASVFGLIGEGARDPAGLARSLGLNPAAIEMHFKHAAVRGPVELMAFDESEDDYARVSVKMAVK
jgi:hypothetical protein